MKKSSKILGRAFTSGKVLFAIVLSIFLVTFYSAYAVQQSSVDRIFTIMVFGLIQVIAVCAGIYAAVCRFALMGFRNSAAVNHDVHHIIRDLIANVMTIPNYRVDLDSRLRAEHQAMKAVCQKIHDHFTLLLNRPVVVSIKLVHKNEKGVFCTTYARSSDYSRRDASGPEVLSLLKGRNSAFDKILLEADSRKTYAFEPNLADHVSYVSERTDYLLYYKSFIIVPIRHPLKYADENTHKNVLGFLSVDTMSANRLNDEFHLETLRSYSDAIAACMITIRAFQPIGLPVGDSKIGVST